MHAYTLRPYTNTREDAAKLAALWNETNGRRPAASPCGTPAVVEDVHDWISCGQGRHVLVADDLAQDKLMGFASLQAGPDHSNSCHVAALSIHPAVQGTELIRQMLAQVVDQAGELGYHRVSLDTSSAEPRSAPVYQEVGFFHVPDVATSWRNYVPLVRQLPATRDYFRRHDWCTTLHSASSPAEDGRKPGVASSLRYRWRADEDTLLIAIDRDAETVTGVETERFAAHVEVDNLISDRRRYCSIRWHVRNKGTQLLNVSIFAEGDDGIKIAHRSALIISGGQGQTVEGRFTISPDLRLAADCEPVPQIHTVLVVGAQIVELNTGIRPRQTMPVYAEPSWAAFFCGRQPVLQRHGVPQGQPA
jgi:GNAT superfamily N-acetyltransferase